MSAFENGKTYRNAKGDEWLGVYERGHTLWCVRVPLQGPAYRFDRNTGKAICLSKPEYDLISPHPPIVVSDAVLDAAYDAGYPTTRPTARQFAQAAIAAYLEEQEEK